MDNIDFDNVATELQRYTSLSHDEIVIGLKAMQQRDRNWKNHSLFMVRLCPGKLNSRLLDILIKNTKFSRSYLFSFLQAGKILIHKQESEIDKIDCTINEFLYKNKTPNMMEVCEVKKIGQYKLDWMKDTMFIYSGHNVHKYSDLVFFSTYGDITNDTIMFYTKEKESDNKNVVTYAKINEIECEIYRFETNIKTLALRTGK
ncbi:MAG: hypothetical protein K2M47_00070 [Clostridiales bacterium]|nr:hypothetical protein [Clostridiales bacterium]